MKWLRFSRGPPTTGDLTHAKFGGERYSRQFEEEWKVYGEVLAESGVRERQPWLDIRGNHGQCVMLLTECVVEYYEH